MKRKAKIKRKIMAPNNITLSVNQERLQSMISDAKHSIIRSRETVQTLHDSRIEINYLRRIAVEIVEDNSRIIKKKKSFIQHLRHLKNEKWVA